MVHTVKKFDDVDIANYIYLRVEVHQETAGWLISGDSTVLTRENKLKHDETRTRVK